MFKFSLFNMHIRYNFLINFDVDQEKIIFTLPNKKISISYTLALEKVLIEIRKNIWLNTWYILEQGVSKNVLRFLIHHQILLDNTNSNVWWEALWFHTLSSNPNKLDHSLTQKEIGNIYKEYESSRKKIPEYFTEVSQDTKKTITIENISRYSWSSRKRNIEWKKIEEPYLQHAMFEITKRKDGKKSYGSWWGFYSVDQVVVTRDNQIYIWVWCTWKIYKASASWIFKDLSQWVLPDEHYTIDWYNAIVCLISNIVFPLMKYGNRWYRFALIESGAIWFLYREMYSCRWYLELSRI